MMARLCLVVALLAGLVAVERVLAARGAGDAPAERAPGRLVPEEQARTMQVAAVTVEAPGRGERYVYVQRDGVWRCMNAHGAVALSNEVGALAGALVGAVGELRSADPARHAAFGLGDAERVTVGLHGARLLEDPDADRLASFDLGASLPGTGEGRGFVRLSGADEVYEIGANPRARLARPADDALPPMLDRRVMAGDFPGPGEGVARAFVDWTDGRSLEVFLRELPPERVLPGRAPREWIAVEGGAESTCLPFRVAAWQAFLYQVGYVGFANPDQRGELGFADGPVVRVSLFLSGGSGTELEVGRRVEGGGAFVWNRKTGMLCLVAPEHVALFAPTAEMLCEPDRPNPWEAWLRR